MKEYWLSIPTHTVNSQLFSGVNHHSNFCVDSHLNIPITPASLSLHRPQLLVTTATKNQQGKHVALRNMDLAVLGEWVVKQGNSATHPS